jgi:AcrR family transcriptional regulator
LTYEKILVSAVDEFADKGFFGARVDAIAETAGVNKRMIYAHFESKELLYSKVLLLAYEWVAGCERDYMKEELSPSDAIKLIVYRSFKFLLDNPKFIRLLMWENLNLATSIPKEELIKLKAPTFDYMKRKLNEGILNGEFSEDIDKDQIVHSLMSFGFAYFTNAHTMSALLGRDLLTESDVTQRADFISNMIIKYLRK